MGNLLVLVSFVLLICIKGHNGCFEEERKALLELKKFFVESRDDSSVLPSWINNNSSHSDCCLWERVTCNSTSGHVIELSLNNLISLKKTSAGWNQISLFQSFEQLRILNLSFNYLPDWITTTGYNSFSRLQWLKKLDLGFNTFSNSILQSLTALSSLQYLSVQFNNFEGSVTNKDLKAFGKLKKLKYVDMRGNSFNKDIMKLLRTSPSLTYVDLSENYMGGSLIGHELVGLSNLEVLILRSNWLSGSLPLEGSFKNLKILDLAGNNFTGSIPAHIGALSSLTKLSLATNSLQGYLPTIPGLCQLKRLQELDLRGNLCLEGNVPPCLINNMTSLKVLDLSSNNFSGTISFDLISPPLQELDLSFNNLQGNLPPCLINNMTSLKFLDLSFNNFNGTISSNLISSSLQELHLGYNNLQGNLPPSLNNLTSLKHLDLSNNQFNGTIPSYLMSSLTSLEYIDLRENSFEGIFSFNSIAYHSNLKVVILGNDHGGFGKPEKTNLHIDVENSIDGNNTLLQLEALGLSNCNLESIPKFLYSQHQLKQVDLSHNKLKGKFPTRLLGTQLQSLNVRNNSFHGPFILPQYLMRNILWLDISNNHFDGQFPEDMGKIFSNLKSLHFSKNSFKGELPSSVGGLENLEMLDLSFNNFTGDLPKELTSGCTSLRFLTLSNNHFSGQFFSAQFNLSKLRYLKLNDNHFRGSLTNVNFNMFQGLEILDVSNNNMTGKIHESFANLLWLFTINMKNNSFEGHFPCGQDLWRLIFVDLSHNFFSGPLPSCFNSGWLLDVVNLEGNRFTGSIPVALFNSTTLTVLNLRNNQLSGGIPEPNGIPNIRILLLGNNDLSGLIPENLCKLEGICMLDLSNNSLFGPIPSCFYNIGFGSTVNGHFGEVSIFYPFGGDHVLENFYSLDLEVPSSIELQLEIGFTTKYLLLPYKGSILDFISGLDLSSNNLTGSIPWSIGDLSSIHALNLSHNHLTGSIPTSFSNLSSMESLDLSYNSLSGEIPLNLIGLNFLEAFSVSHNNLSGKIPFIQHLTTFDESSYEGNPFLCGKPLATNCTRDVDDLPPQSPMATSVESDGKWYEVDLMSFFGSLAATYIMFLLGFATILYINPYWRRRWINFIEDFIDSCYYYAFHIFH